MQNVLTSPNTKLPQPKRNQILKKLTQRFNYDKIINEQYYIKNMTQHLTININILLKDQLLNNIPNNIAIQILEDIPYFNINTNKKYIKIEYQCGDRVLIITGIKKQVIKQWLELCYKQYQKRFIINKEINLGYWYIIEFNNYEIAMCAKKFFRSKKVQQDSQDDQRRMLGKDCYKYPCRRVRIVLLNQDFFTILYDQINQAINQKFIQAIQSKGDSLVFKDIIYLSLYGGQRIQQKQQQIDDVFSSQFLSQTQSAHDSTRIKQIDVETSNQGTQIEHIQFMDNVNYIGDVVNLENVNVGDKWIGMLDNLQDGQFTVNNVGVEVKKIQVLGYDKGRKSGSGHSPNNLSSNSQNQDKQLQIKNGKNVQNSHKNDQIQIEIHKNRTNSACLPHTYNPNHLLQLQPIPKTITNPTNKHNPTQQNNQNSQQQFPSLNIPEQQSNNKQQSKSQDTNYTRYQYLDIKKKYNQFIRQQNNTFDQSYNNITVPDYIRKQSQMKQYYKKFHLEVIKKAHKIVTRSKIPYI